MFHVKHEITHSGYSTASLERVGELFREYEEKLNEYAAELLWWNQRVNLVSRDVSRETIMEHIRHSLTISGSSLFKEGKTIIDTGTGGGLPGIPLAICFPEKEFLLNDIVSKKVMAVKQMCLKLGLDNIKAVSGSIEDQEIKEEHLIITKHAFKIWELTELLKSKDWKELIFLKGESEAENEIREVEGDVKMNIINLDKTLTDEFYSGKAIVELSRMHNE